MLTLILGRTDYAIVGGTHMSLDPNSFSLQQHSGLSSRRGISAAFDESADGFAKGDGTACLLLQKRSTAKRVYATVLSSRVNADGRKNDGMFIMSSASLEELMVMAYKESKIDPLKLTYLETHCTGTKVIYHMIFKIYQIFKLGR